MSTRAEARRYTSDCLSGDPSLPARSAGFGRGGGAQARSAEHRRGWASLLSPDDPTGTHALTGHENDGEIGLVNMKGRVFDPRLGRFLTTDPIVSDISFGQSFNPYSYVLNNPLTYVDPSGFEGEPPGDQPLKPGPDGVIDVHIYGEKPAPRPAQDTAEKVGVAVPATDTDTTGSTPPETDPPETEPYDENFRVLEKRDALNRYDQIWRRWKRHVRFPVRARSLVRGAEGIAAGVGYTAGAAEWIRQGGILRQRGCPQYRVLAPRAVEMMRHG